MELNDNKVSEFIALVQEMVNISPLNDIKATKYNKLYDKADVWNVEFKKIECK